MKAIILVGGEGTRLRPLTLERLKSTVPMAGRAFLEHQFYFLKRHGVKDITLSICHMPALIKKAFGDGRRYGIRLHYAIEDKPLGTAGAVKNAEVFAAGHEPVAVLNGDVLSGLDLTAMARQHRRQQALVTISLTWVEDPSAYGLVYTQRNGRVARFVEKPDTDEADCHWINAGIYLFDPAVFATIPSRVNYSSERGLFPNLLASRQRVWSFPSRDYWIDIGTPAKYLKANIDILEGRVPGLINIGKPAGKGPLASGRHCKIHPTAECIQPNLMGEGCEVGAQARIGESSVLGNRVMVGAHALVRRSVIWDDVVIGEGAQVSGCILGFGCHIGKYANLRNGTVLGNRAVVPDYSIL